MATTAEATYVFNQTVGMVEAINEHGESIIISDINAIDDNQMQMGQVVIGHEVEVMSVNPGRTSRPPSRSNRPSLLRRGPRTSAVPSHVTAYPPQISPSILSRYGLKNASASPTASYLSGLSSRSSGSSLSTDRKPVISAQARRRRISASGGKRTVSGGAGSVAKNNVVEEIVVWPHDMDDYQIVEVDEGQLQQYLQNQETGDGQEQEVEFKYEEEEEGQAHAFQLEDGTFIDPATGQQLIICDDGQNLDLSGLVVQLQTLSNGQLRKAGKVSKRKLATELKCQEEGCDGVVNNVIDLRKHLQTQHMMELDEENVLFANDDEFRTWRANYERDRKVSFIYRGGTKKISTEKAVTYLICHRSGVYKPTPGAATDRKRKMKPQGSCKIGTHCTAGVKLLKNLINGTIEATICHTHYGHELENIQHLRVNVTIKEILLGKFDEGMSFAQVLQYVHHNPDGLEGLHVVDRRAIRNIYDQWKKLNNVSNQPRQSLAERSVEEKEDPLLDSVILHTAEITDAEPGESQSEETSEHSARSSTTEIKRGSEEDPLHNTSAGGMQEPSAATVTSNRPGSKSSKEPAPIKSLNELVHESIQNLLEHGESGPTVLFYKRIGSKYPVCGDDEGYEVSKSLSKDHLCVVLQTPVQRQLLQMFGKLLYVDVINASDLDLLMLAVLDEFLTAIPVAWMIVSEVTSANVELCFRCIKENCDQVKCEYFYSSRAVDHYALWSKVFGKKPRLMLSQEDTIKDFVALVRRQFDEEELRVSFNKELEILVTTPDRQKYEESLKSIKLKSSSVYKALARDWLLNKSQWAYHARLHLPFVIEESFARLKKFVLFKGTKKLSRNIGNVLKIGYDRCFQRNKSLFKGDLKFQQILDTIQANHDADLGEDVKIVQVSAIKYTIQNKFTVYDLRTDCKCKIRCKSCDVCAHRYWCTCGDNANFCVHAHKVCLHTKASSPVKMIKIERPAVVEQEPQPVFLQLVETQDFAKLETQPAPTEEEEWYEEEANEEGEEVPEEDPPAPALGEAEISQLEDKGPQIIRTASVALSPRRSPKRNAVVEHLETSKISSVPESNLQSDQRRTSSRIKQKVTKPMEDEFEAVVVHKRGRRDSNLTSQPPATNLDTSTSTPVADPPASPSKGRRPGRPPKRQGAYASETSTSQEDVKEEIQNLLYRLSSIKDEKVLSDIRKRVSDITESLGSS